RTDGHRSPHVGRQYTPGGRVARSALFAVAPESQRRRKGPQKGPGAYARARGPFASCGKFRSRGRSGHRRSRSHENAKRNQVAEKRGGEKNLGDPRGGGEPWRHPGHRRMTAEQPLEVKPVN